MSTRTSPGFEARRRRAQHPVCVLSVALSCTLLFGPSAQAQDIEIVAQPARWRTTLEYVDAKGVDTTLLGVHFDVLDFWTPLPGGYVGVGGFGGVLGERGGYFAGGTTFGWRKPLGERIGFDAGLFIGAGGESGGSASLGEVGDGFMMRPHLALEWYGEGFDWRLALTHINASGGDVEGTQLALGVSISDEFLLATRAFQDLDVLDPEEFFDEDFSLTSRLTAIFPSSRSRTNTDEDLDDSLVIGSIGFERGLNDGWFTGLQVGGAISGSSGGYLSAMAGLGRRWAWIEDTLDVVLRGWLGAAGGGGVDTGGGLVAQADVGVDVHFSPAWSAHLGTGYMAAIDGNFDGIVLESGVTWRPGAWSLPPEFDRGRLDSQGLYDEDVSLDDWRFLLLHKSLSLTSNAVPLAGGDFDDIQLLGIGAEKPLTRSVDLSLRAFGAWGGDAGGYHEGQVGVAYRLKSPELLEEAGELSIAYHLGAVGGGPVSLEDGLSHQFSLGWRFEPRPGLWFGVEVATFDTSGPFDGESFGFGFAADLSRPTGVRD